MKRRDFVFRSLAFLSGLSMRTEARSASPTETRSVARQFYLDSQLGDDSNTGTTLSSPWRSLARLNVESLGAGDSVFLRRGRKFSGQLKPKGSGAKGRPIVLASYGDGAIPVIQANGKFDSALCLENVEYFQVSDLEISNWGEADAPRRAGVLIRHLDFGIAHSITLRRLVVRDVNGSKIKRQGGGGGIVVQATGKVVATRHDGLMIVDCQIVNTQRDGIVFLSAGSRTGGLATNVVVSGNELRGVPGDCILVVGCAGALIERNIVRDCGRLPAGEAAAGIWPFNCDDTVIQFNEVSGHKARADGQAFDADLACRRTLIQYNYSHDNEGGLALICNMGGKDLGAGNELTVLRRNLSINDGRRTAIEPLVRVTGPVQGSEVYNNVFIVLSQAEPAAGPVVARASNWAGTPVDIKIHDNVVASMVPAKFAMNLADQFQSWGNLSLSARPRASSVIGDLLNVGTQPFEQNLIGDGLTRMTDGAPRMTMVEVARFIDACFEDGRVSENAASIVKTLISYH